MDLKIAKRQAGFTLIEIIISIFIVTLLLGVATMSFQSIQEEGKLKNEGVAVKLAARKLMRQAVEKNQSYTMTLAPGFFATGPSYSNQSLESTYIGSGEDLERELRTIKGQQHAFEDGIQLWVESMPVHRHVACNEWCESAVLNSVKICVQRDVARQRCHSMWVPCSGI